MYEFSVFKLIIVSLMTVVCICWLKSQKLHIVTFFFSYGSTALYGPGPPRFVEVS
jgi:hypothetical protein